MEKIDNGPRFNRFGCTTQPQGLRMIPPAHNHLPEPIIPNENEIRLRGLVATAQFLRDRGLAVAMVGDEGLIEFTNDFGEHQVWSTGGFERMFLTKNVRSLAINTSQALLLEGPLSDRDKMTGLPRFPATLEHHSSSGLITRIYSTAASLGSRSLQFEQWTLKSGVEFLDCVKLGQLKFANTPIAIVPGPAEFLDALLNGPQR